MDSDRKRSEIEVYDGDLKGRPEYGSLWDTDHHNTLLEYGPEGAFRELLESHAASGNVLVLGCGEGTVAQRLADENSCRQVWGIEISETRLRRAAANDQANLSFLRADAERLPFEYGSFDVVVAHSILHHLPSWRTVGLDEICRVLDPSGTLLFYEPGRYNPPAAVRRAFIPSSSHTPDERPFDPSELSDTLSTRFTTVDLTGHCILSNTVPVLDHHLPMTIPHEVSTRLYRIERQILSQVGDKIAWILTGVAEEPE